jgi:predicted lipoprotein with Yx(FWY)xxD motif
MKKLTLTLTTGLFLLAFAGNAMASTAVSQMATEKGGQAVSECAITMDKGVSECAILPICN